MNAALVLRNKPLVMSTTSFSLSTGDLILGRASKCDLVVKHDTVSRRHAVISVTQCATTVRDLVSRNGTFLDGIRVVTAEMRPGQHVIFGNVRFLMTTDQLEKDFSGSEEETAKCETPSPSVVSTLSRAQRRVFDLILTGLAEKKIASQLCLSPTTVHNHIQAIYRAFNVHSRSELLARFLAKSDD